MKALLFASSAIVWAVGAMIPAHAQDTANPAPASAPTQDGKLEEIIVTAQRRGENLQKVPISVNAATASQLQARGIDDVRTLAATVPALDVSTQGQASTPYLRGIGSNASDPNNESSVAFYVDGIYIASPFASMTSYNNVERVEVLKGPQGTLFGRNATGGVIQVITKDPSYQSHFEGSIGYGNYNTFTASGYATAGLTDGVALDLAIRYMNQQDGFGHNLLLDKDVQKQKEFSARSKLMIEPDDLTKIIIAGDYARMRNSLPDFHLPKGVVGLDGNLNYYGDYNSVNNRLTDVKTETGGVSLRIERDLDFARLISLTARRITEGDFDFDSDATPVVYVDALLHNRVRNWSQELQLASQSSSSTTWLLGAFYYDGDAQYSPGRLAGLAVAPGLPYVDLNGKQVTKSYSVYGQGTVEVVPRLRLTGGLRYTHERQTFDFVFGALGTETPSPRKRQSFSKLTWRAAIDYDFSATAKAYVSANRGIKSGGFDLLNGSSPGYRPEQLDAYEVGLKTELFDRTLRFNLAAFRYDYKDIQVTAIRSAGTITANAARARVNGAEAEMEWHPTASLTLNAGVSYLDGKYKDFPNPLVFPASPSQPPIVLPNAQGKDTVRTPHWTGNAGFLYRLPTEVGPFTLSSSVYYNDGFYFDAGNQYRQKSYATLAASLGWTDRNDRFSVRFWGKNLTDTRYVMQGTPSAQGNLTVIAAPRTYGVTLSVKSR